MEQGNRFGMVKTVGDFNNDSYDDLAISATREDLAGNQFRHQATRCIADDKELGDRSGEALAASDFGSNGFNDLTIGVDSEDLALETLNPNVGKVPVLYDTSTRLSAASSQLWHQKVGGIAMVGGSHCGPLLPGQTYAGP